MKKKILKMEADIAAGTLCKPSKYCHDSIYKPGANSPVHVQTCKRGIFSLISSKKQRKTYRPAECRSV